MEKTYIKRNCFMEDVYDAMHGDYAPGYPTRGIEDAFAIGEKCQRLYAQVYDAERRLEERLGVDPYDKDVECIIRCMTDIQEELCYRMYCYGARFGMRE